MELWDGDEEEPRHVIVNTEWGGFGDQGALDFIRTKWDMAGIRGHLDSWWRKEETRGWDVVKDGTYLAYSFP